MSGGHPALPSGVYVALDTEGLAPALSLARAVAPHVAGLKVGLELFVSVGPEGVRQLASLGLPLFLDLKLHDIPNTVAGAVRAAARLGVACLTLHAGGGAAMLRAAAEAAAAAGPDRPRLLAVTVLTSLDDEDLAATGHGDGAESLVPRLAALALANGADGLVCAAPEVAALRARFGPGPLLAVPGLRPGGAATQDQKRTLSPAAARAAGADLLVVGRPITQAADPAAAAATLTAGLAA